MINRNVEIPLFLFLHRSDHSCVFFNLHDSVVNIQTVLENEATTKNDITFELHLNKSSVAHIPNFTKNKFFHICFSIILLKF